MGESAGRRAFEHQYEREESMQGESETEGCEGRVKRVSEAEWTGVRQRAHAAWLAAAFKAGSDNARHVLLRQTDEAWSAGRKRKLLEKIGRRGAGMHEQR
eukprot:6199238-Pleurochrysis_carterae.AAC.2